MLKSHFFENGEWRNCNFFDLPNVHKLNRRKVTCRTCLHTYFSCTSIPNFPVLRDFGHVFPTFFAPKTCILNFCQRLNGWASALSTLCVSLLFGFSVFPVVTIDSAAKSSGTSEETKGDCLSLWTAHETSFSKECCSVWMCQTLDQRFSDEGSFFLYRFRAIMF